VLNLQVRWQQPQPVCLYQQHHPAPLLCGDNVSGQLQLVLEENTQLELRSQNGETVLAQRLIKVLQVDLNAGDQLLKRSRSWGTP